MLPSGYGMVVHYLVVPGLVSVVRTICDGGSLVLQ